jgi:hypothetical protein
MADERMGLLARQDVEESVGAVGDAFDEKLLRQANLGK